jgi:hypothetical protein
MILKIIINEKNDKYKDNQEIGFIWGINFNLTN